MADKLLNILGLGNEEIPNKISESNAYRHFRSKVALKRFVVDNDNNKVWSVFECGPKESDCPVVFFPPVSGSADIFFHQLIFLSEHGYRVISAEYPAYFTMQEFILGFKRFMEFFCLRKVHIFGASLGGFLAQKFCEENSSLVASLFLCNTFADTSRFKFVNTLPLVWFAPTQVLRHYFVQTEIPENVDESIREASKFMNNSLHSLSHTELLSRLNLNLTECYVIPDSLQSIPITVMDVFDHCANSIVTREELYKMYPNAKRAHLKTGGNFPYLSRVDEVNMHLLVHLRQFSTTEDDEAKAIDCSADSFLSNNCDDDPQCNNDKSESNSS